MLLQVIYQHAINAACNLPALGFRHSGQDCFCASHPARQMPQNICPHVSACAPASQSWQMAHVRWFARLDTMSFAVTAVLAFLLSLSGELVDATSQSMSSCWQRSSISLNFRARPCMAPTWTTGLSSL